MTSVVIADDHPFLRAGLEAVLHGAGIAILASCGDGEELLDMLEQTNPDVVILDLQMPRLGGIAALEALRRRGDDRPVILLTARIDDAQLLAALTARADAIVLKDGAERHLLATIDAVLAGEKVIPPALAARAVELAMAGPQADPLAPLSRREHEIVEAVARGLRNREIGDLLSITEGSVKVYLNRIFDKLGVENRTGLAILVHQRNAARQAPLPAQRG